jgi:hypothetical protein
MSNACRAAASPPDRRITHENADVLIVCVAALPLGLGLDQWFGHLPALTAYCGESVTLLGMLEWHWACMPLTCLMMLFAAPAWIGLKALARPHAHQQHRWRNAVAPLACHSAMLIGMAWALGAGPSLAALVAVPWTSGAAMGAMTCGMGGGMAAALLCQALGSGATWRWGLISR